MLLQDKTSLSARTILLPVAQMHRNNSCRQRKEYFIRSGDTHGEFSLFSCKLEGNNSGGKRGAGALTLPAHSENAPDPLKHTSYTLL